MTFFIVVFVFVMQFVWKYVDDLVGKGLTWDIIAELLFYASATFVPMALPLAILLSSLMTFGNLGEKYELVAMKAAGISIRKAMLPLIVVSFLISGLAFLFSNYVMPVANLKFTTILYDITKHKLALSVKEGIYDSTIEGYVLRVNKKDPDGKTMYDVMIYDHKKRDGNNRLITAKKGIMEFSEDKSEMIFTLFDGYNYEEDNDKRNKSKKPYQRMYFEKEIKRFDMSSFQMKRSNEDFFKNSYKMLKLAQLEHAEDSLTKDLATRKYRYNNTLKGKLSYYLKIDSTKVRGIPDSALVNTDSLFHTFSEKNQSLALERALANAKDIQHDIKHMKERIFRKKSGRIYRHQIEWHRKFTLSFACIILFFIGAPLGAIIRKGGLGLPLVISVVLFIIYHIISITGEKSVRTGEMDAFIGMWLSSIIAFPFGVFLTIKATTDAPLLDKDIYVKLLNTIKELLKGKKTGNA